MDVKSSNSAQNIEDSEYETDEEALVHVSVSGTLQEDLRNLKFKDFSFIDINSRAPLLVIGNQIFSGEYQDCVGTSVFFTQSENDQQQDKVFNRQCTVSVDYCNSTKKKLILKRVFLNKKSGSGKESSQGNNQGSEDSSSSKK